MASFALVLDMIFQKKGFWKNLKYFRTKLKKKNASKSNVQSKYTFCDKTHRFIVIVIEFFIGKIFRTKCSIILLFENNL